MQIEAALRIDAMPPIVKVKIEQIRTKLRSAVLITQCLAPAGETVGDISSVGAPIISCCAA